MKRFGRQMLLFGLIQVVALAAVVALAQPANNYLAAVIDKELLLAQTPSPRVVLVGDSSLAFGVDSKVVEIALGGNRHVFNMGLHAGLGLDFMLDETLAGVRPGDVVVVSPNYDTLWYDTMQPIELGELLRFQPSAWRFVAPRDRLRLGLSMVSDQPIVALHDLATTAMYRVTGQRAQGVYYRSAFNRLGDHVAARKLASVLNIASVEETATVDTRVFARNLETLRRFAAAARARGARVFVALPPIRRERLRAQRAQIDSTVAQIQSVSGVPVIDEPGSVAFTAESFYDSPAHLRGEAVMRRSRDLALQLKAALLRWP